MLWSKKSFQVWQTIIFYYDWKDKSDVGFHFAGWCLEAGWGAVCCGDDQRFARNIVLKQIDVVNGVEKP